MQRCDWCVRDTVLINYHDQEWAVPVYEDEQLFELLILETMQAGLNWLTILRKRDHFRQAFANFNPQKIALYSDKEILQLLANPNIIRHRLKIKAAIHNARAFLAIKEQGRFADYIWQFGEGKIRHNSWQNQQQVPSRSTISDAMAKDLKKRGFSFIGSTTCYAYMQAIGMVNDHLLSCFRYPELARN